MQLHAKRRDNGSLIHAKDARSLALRDLGQLPRRHPAKLPALIPPAKSMDGAPGTQDPWRPFTASLKQAGRGPIINLILLPLSGAVTMWPRPPPCIPHGDSGISQLQPSLCRTVTARRPRPSRRPLPRSYSEQHAAWSPVERP